MRRRLLISVAAWLLACAALWPKAPRLVAWLLQPLGAPAVFLGPAEGFMVTLKCDLAAAAALASPVIGYQAICFLLPALKARERRIVGGLGVFAAGAFAAGAWFAWGFLVPAMMRFFMSFASEALRPQITADRYFSFVFWIVLGCGIAAEYPIVTMGLAAAGIVRARTLLRQWRPAMVICAVAAAIVTPSPDAATMVMVMVPLIGLYVLGIGTAALAGK